MITSSSNKKLKNVIQLNSKAKERKKQGVFVAEGVKMFLEAPLDQIEQVFISATFYNEQAEKKTSVHEKIGKIRGRLGEEAVETVLDELFVKISDTMTPQGILCVQKSPSYRLEELIGKDKGLFLVLEDIQDPGNLGTMLRAGEGAGVTGCIMSRGTVDLFNPKTIRATMGSIYRVPFVYTSDLAAAIEKMKESGIRTFAAHLKGEKSYDREPYLGKTAFLIGNEGNGLSREIADLADTYIKIPMLGEVESLNAAIAATLLVYEAARQRRE